MSRKAPRGLKQDDLQVWQKVARSTRPLSKNVEFRVSRLETKPADERPKSSPQRAIQPFSVGEKAGGSSCRHELAGSVSSQLGNHPLRMDAKAFARMKRGKLRPERSLDLHGMTVAEAHPKLIGFIRKAHADGLRLVVVITGKGKGGRDDGGPIPVPRGILRHQVPGWLHAAPLRPYVLQVTDAHVRHGGTGAYYVYLTRHR